METHGPLGILWTGLGLCGFYIGLLWINSLLGMFLSPFFILPITKLHDRRKRRQLLAREGAAPAAAPGTR